MPPLKSDGDRLRRVEMLERVPVWVRRFVVWARSTGLKRVVYPGVLGAVESVDGSQLKASVSAVDSC